MKLVIANEIIKMFYNMLWFSQNDKRLGF